MKTIRNTLGIMILITTLLGCSSKSPITDKEAKKIAVSDAGTSLKEVTFTKEGYDEDDNEYHFEFYNETHQFEYEIDGLTGDIQSREKEQRKTNQPSAEKRTLSEEQQKYVSIALEHFQLTQDEITDINVKPDTEDEISIYEVTFLKDQLEYKCEIRTDDQSIYHSEIDHD